MSSFVVPRLIWLALNPLNLLLLALCLALVLLLTRWRRAGRRLLVACSVVLVVLAVLPVGRFMIALLESRFPPGQTAPAEVHGIILLGGSVNLKRSEMLGIPVVNANAERLTRFVALAERFPEAELVFSGGSGELIPGSLTEAGVSARVLGQLGLDTRRVLFEDRARNTYESALLLGELRPPASGETWILVTSAFHMPRAVGVFRKAGWPVIADATDYRTGGIAASMAPRFDLIGGLKDFHFATRAWIGLIAYRLMGRTDELLPGAPAPIPASQDSGEPRK